MEGCTQSKAISHAYSPKEVLCDLLPVSVPVFSPRSDPIYYLYVDVQHRQYSARLSFRLREKSDALLSLSRLSACNEKPIPPLVEEENPLPGSRGGEGAHA
jgi:hypothetical protein